jgi:hypothetical protein
MHVALGSISSSPSQKNRQKEKKQKKKRMISRALYGNKRKQQSNYLFCKTVSDLQDAGCVPLPPL